MEFINIKTIATFHAEKTNQIIKIIMSVPQSNIKRNPSLAIATATIAITFHKSCLKEIINHLLIRKALLKNLVILMFIHYLTSSLPNFSFYFFNFTQAYY